MKYGMCLKQILTEAVIDKSRAVENNEMTSCWKTIIIQSLTPSVRITRNCSYLYSHLSSGSNIFSVVWFGSKSYGFVKETY